MIKIIIQEERFLEELGDNGFPVITGKEKHLVTIHEASSEDRVVLAALLRGMADRWDPPKQ